MEVDNSSSMTSDAAELSLGSTVKPEVDELDELAGEAEAAEERQTASQRPSPESTAIRLGSEAGPLTSTAPVTASHQHLQAVLLQQQQLQRSRPPQVTGIESGHSSTAARTLLRATQGQPGSSVQTVGHSQNRCANCGTVSASLWRREPQGQALCNTCGLASIKKSSQSSHLESPKAASPFPTANTERLPVGSERKDVHLNTSAVDQSSRRFAPQASTSALPVHSAVAVDRVSVHSGLQGSPSAQSVPLDGLNAPRQLVNGHLPRSTGSGNEWRHSATTAANGRLRGVMPVNLPISSAASSDSSNRGSAARPTDSPVGSCPGDGRCNGQGGKAACTGCPAFNNRYRVIASNGAPRSQPDTNGHASPRLQAISVVPREAISELPVQQPDNSERSNNGSADSQSATRGIETRTSPEATHAPSGGGSEISAMACENCGTRTTPLWRRDGEGRVACNACGLYYKLHGAHRPVNMNKTTIKRRKRVPAVAGAQEGTSVSSAGPSGDQIDVTGPARKKARKIQQELLKQQHQDADMSNGAPYEVYTPTSDASHGQRELTRTELEVIAALAMNANHERSLMHSASLDSDLLDHHSHPLHSVPASVPNDRYGSLVPPVVRPPSDYSFGSPRDRASNQSLASDEEQIALYRQDLARECDQARVTLSRLQDFLSRSEQVLSALDERLARAKANSSRSGESKEAGPSPLKYQIESPSPLVSGTNEPPKQKLQTILATFTSSEARPSQLLRKRKFEAVHETKESSRSGLTEGERPRKLLWEICPSGRTNIEIISSRSTGEGQPSIRNAIAV